MSLVVIGPFDALSACEIEGKVITSPNSPVIPLPPWKERKVYARADQRFGHDDFTLWPQFFSREHQHLAAIPSRPLTSSDPFSLLWWDVTAEYFIPHPSNTVAGFGELSMSKYAEMDALRTQLVSRMLRNKSNLSELQPALQTLYKQMNHTLLRLTGCPMTLLELKFTMAEFQRYFLEVVGFLLEFRVFR